MQDINPFALFIGYPVDKFIEYLGSKGELFQ